MMQSHPKPFSPDYGAIPAILPPERRVSKFPGRDIVDGVIHFAFDDGQVRTIKQFAWFDEGHMLYIDGSDIIERYGDDFFVIHESSEQAAHDRLHCQIYVGMDAEDEAAE